MAITEPFRADKAYITRGRRMWNVGFLNRERGVIRFLHYYNWASARLAVRIYWDNVPATQNGYPTEVLLPERPKCQYGP